MFLPAASRATRTRARSPLRTAAALLLVMSGTAAAPALANNWGESASWQFATPQDLAAQAAARDMIERRRGGVYPLTPAT